jgi:hypothetical protein
VLPSSGAQRNGLPVRRCWANDRQAVSRARGGCDHGSPGVPQLGCRLWAPVAVGAGDAGHGSDRRSCHHLGSNATACAQCARVMPATIAATSTSTCLLWASSRVTG